MEALKRQAALRKVQHVERQRLLYLRRVTA